MCDDRDDGGPGRSTEGRPPVPDTFNGPVEQRDIAATVQCGDIYGQIERFAYWHPNDGEPMDVTFEVRINGLPETAGICNVYAEEPGVLVRLAQVSQEAARLLAEYQ